MNPRAHFSVSRLAAFSLCWLSLCHFAIGTAEAQLPGGGRSGSLIVELQKGIGLLQKGENRKAKTHFVAMAERYPNAAMATYYWALSCAALEETDDCLTALKASIERGWEKPEGLRTDAGFQSLMEKDARFRKGLDALLAAVKSRQEKGTIDSLDLGSLAYVNLLESEHSLEERRGKPLAVLFLQSTGGGLTALWALEAAAKERRESIGVLVLVECTGKGTKAKLDTLSRFQLENRIELPIGLATIDQRRQLRPWKEFPTLLILNGASRAVHIVDGFPANLEERYAIALGAATPPTVPPEEGDSKAEPGPAKPPQKTPNKAP